MRPIAATTVATPSVVICSAAAWTSICPVPAARRSTRCRQVCAHCSAHLYDSWQIKACRRRLISRHQQPQPPACCPGPPTGSRGSAQVCWTPADALSSQLSLDSASSSEVRNVVTILCRLAKCCDAIIFALAAKFHLEPHDVVRSIITCIKDSFCFYFSILV